MLSPQEQRLYSIVGERVREKRSQCNPQYTQAGLAELVGVKRTSITNLEHGNQHFPLHVLLRLAQRLDCEMRDLIPTRAELLSRDMSDIEVVPPPYGDISEKTSAVIRKYASSPKEDAR